jgi:hypothetical protein
VFGNHQHSEDVIDEAAALGVFGFAGLASKSLGSLGTNAGDDGHGRNRRIANVFVNDPCLDPPFEAGAPAHRARTVQSETEIAVLNPTSGTGAVDDHGDDDGEEAGRLMVAGYNDSFGFYDNRQGLSGFSYSTDGGKTWIDAGGLPPKVPSGAPAGTPGSDAFFGDPVVAVHHRTKTFYYSSIYQNAAGAATLSVSRGRFTVAPQQVPVESFANTRCEGNPLAYGIPDSPAFVRERIIWDPPVEAVPPVFGDDGLPGTDDDDFLDKEWLHVDQRTGTLYMTYTRFTAAGETPLELVRSYDRGQTWTAPTVIVPNLLDTFNQATMPVTTPPAAANPLGRVVVTWFSRTFDVITGAEISQRIESTYSVNDGNSFPAANLRTVAGVNPQGEPLGYNRGRFTILNAPFITINRGKDDGMDTPGEAHERGFGDMFITYFSGKTALPQSIPAGCLSQQPCNPFARVANVFLSRSRNGASTWDPRVKVNSDTTETTHVFPSVQVNKNGIVYTSWLDRRLDPANNVLNDTWAAASENSGASLGTNVRVTNISTSWYQRADARPNFGDYNSSALINYERFASIWANGRFPPGPQAGPTTPVAERRQTPDSIFAVIKGLPTGGED